MKTVKTLAILLAATGLAACSWSPDAANPGNPNDMPYAGEKGSVYDAAANPPRDLGQARYDAAGPLASLPSQATPTPRPPAVTAERLAPLPR